MLGGGDLEVAGGGCCRCGGGCSACGGVSSAAAAVCSPPAGVLPAVGCGCWGGCSSDCWSALLGWSSVWARGGACLGTSVLELGCSCWSSEGKAKVYPPKFRRACRLHTFMAQWRQRRKSWSPFWTSSAPLDRTSGTSCTLMCHTIGCPCVRGPTGLTNRVSSMPMYPCIIGWVLVIKTKGMGNVGRFVCPGVCLTAKIAQMPAGMAWATMASEGPTQAVCPETRAARGGCRWLPRAWHLGRCRRLVWAGVRLTCPLLLRPGLRLLFVGCQLVVWWVAVVVAHWCCGASSLARLVGCHCCSHQWAAWWPLCAWCPVLVVGPLILGCSAPLPAASVVVGVVVVVGSQGCWAWSPVRSPVCLCCLFQHSVAQWVAAPLVSGYSAPLPLVVVHCASAYSAPLLLEVVVVGALLRGGRTAPSVSGCSDLVVVVRSSFAAAGCGCSSVL